MSPGQRAIFGNIWKPYGLRGDPFFQEELGVGPETSYPARLLFVGRGEELHQIGRRIGGSDVSRTIVEGEAGVGKTTFVNRVKAELAESGDYAVHEDPIRPTSESTSETLLADILRVLIRLYNEGGAPRDEFWEKAGFLVEGQSLTSGGISIAGSGASIQKQRVAPEIGHGSLIPVISEALRRIQERYGTAVVIHINNLENLSLEEATRASVLIQNVRDVFLQTGAHWLFVGDRGIEDTIFRRSDQVGGIFPAAVTLAPLSPEDVAAMLESRYRHLCDDERAFTPPIIPNEAARLYERYRGDLRNFLRLLSDAATRILGVEGVEPMTREQVLASAGREYRQRILEAVGERDFEYLTNIAEAAEGKGGFFRVTDVAEWIDVTQSGASKIVERLEEANLIREERQEGRNVYYAPTGTTSVALSLSD